MHTGWLGNNRSGQTFIRSDETIVLKSVRIIIKYPDSAVLSPIVSSSFDFPTLFTRGAGRVDGKLKWKLRENWGGSGGLVFFILEIIFSLRTKYENWKITKLRDRGMEILKCWRNSKKREFERIGNWKD